VVLQVVADVSDKSADSILKPEAIFNSHAIGCLFEETRSTVFTCGKIQVSLFVTEHTLPRSEQRCSLLMWAIWKVQTTGNHKKGRQMNVSMLLLLIIIRVASGRSVVTYVKEKTVRCLNATLAHGNFLQTYSNIYPTRCNVTQFVVPGNYSTCFGWYHHPSSGAQTNVSTAYATHSTLKPVPSLPR